jgi:hypothetical protein
MELYTLAWKSENEERALRAIEKITDRNLLVDIAKNAGDSDVRKVAVEKLICQNVYADVVKMTDTPHID